MAEPEWAYRAVQGDSLTAIARNYLLPAYGWKHLQQRNRLTNPHHLLPGNTLSIPVAWLRREASVAEVLFVQGETTVVREPGSAASVAIVGDRLTPGARLSTGAQSSLVLRLADGSRLMLTPQTQVTLEHLLVFGRSGLSQAGLQLLGGGLEAQVPPRQAPMPPLQIRTPTATLGVRGTQFRAASDGAAGSGRVEVLTGAVVAQAGREVRVEAGFGAVAATTLSDPRPLLPAPGLAPALGQLTCLPAQQAWQLVPGASAYRAQLFGDGKASELLADQTGPEATVRWSTLHDGRYWLRVRAIAADGLEGFDALWPFEFALAPEPGPAAPLSASPPDADTLVGATATVSWTAISAATHYRIQVAASVDFVPLLRDIAAIEPGTFNLVQFPLTLPPGLWFWRVASVSAAGVAGPFGETRSFTLRAQPP